MEKTTVTELYAKMKEFVHMEEELEFPLFSSYFQSAMSLLQSDYQELSNEDLSQMRAICAIMSENAGFRAAKKDANRKKFQKMQEKSGFWQEAIVARLKKDGMSEEEIQEAQKALFAENEGD